MNKKSRTRRSANETRDVMVAEGLRLLQEHGVWIGVDHVTLDAACIATDVPRSSSHSAWAIDDDYTPQVTFQRAVLRSWLNERENSMFADAATEALGRLFAAENAPTKSAIVRTAIQAAFEEGYNVGDKAERVGGDYLSTDMAIRFAIASQPAAERDPELLASLRSGELANRSRRIEDSYRPLGEILQMRPKEVYGEKAYVFFGIVIASLVEGIGLRNAILPELELDKPLFDGRAGDVPTLLIGACVEALIPVFFEAISDEPTES
jgi:hypothetical protein